MVICFVSYFIYFRLLRHRKERIYFCHVQKQAILFLCACVCVCVCVSLCLFVSSCTAERSVLESKI